MDIYTGLSDIDQCMYNSLTVLITNSAPLNYSTFEEHYFIVVYRSSETSTYQSDLIIRSNDRFLNLVVDSDSIVSKIYA
jgi:hypothetical protein